MTSKPNIDDIITAFSALRLQLVEEAGELGAMAADGRQDADTLRRSGYCDFALAAEKRAQRADWIAMNLADASQRIGRIFGDPRPPARRSGEWQLPTPEETAESLADTAVIGVGLIAAANAEDDK